jgi:hypothetical protein
MIKLNGILADLPKELKLLIGVFGIVLSIGFYSGITFVNETSGTNPKGIEENYLGNEEDEEADVMKFKKSEKEMLSIIHSHTITMSLMFLIVGFLVYLTKIPKGIKMFLIIEPFASILLTFGGIYFLWKGHLFMKYIVIFSGVLMTITYTISMLTIVFQLLKPKK